MVDVFKNMEKFKKRNALLIWTVEEYFLVEEVGSPLVATSNSDPCHEKSLVTPQHWTSIRQDNQDA